MHDNRRQRIALKKPAFRIANLTGIQFCAPYAIFRTLLAGTRDGSQGESCCEVRRLVLLRSFLCRTCQRQAGLRIEVVRFRHLIDRLFRRLLRRDSGVLLLLPLECAVPRRKLCGGKGHDFVDVRNFGITAIITIDELAYQFIAPRTLGVIFKTKVIQFIGCRRPFKAIFKK
ncbi:hypothetical protein WJ02_16200 [Burkholderia vietnamiensis]|nr:hypothetical protein WJ02_16200 [Burkholderia vietnamiensis]